jgi:hypothetical protein
MAPWRCGLPETCVPGDPAHAAERAHAGLFYPYEAERHVFYVYTSGLLFMLHVGKTMNPGAAVLCAWNRPEHPILISELLMEKFQDTAREEFLEARQTQSFLRVMDKIAKEARSSTVECGRLHSL